MTWSMKKASARFRADVEKTYTLTPDITVMLDQVTDLMDRLDAIKAEWIRQGRPMMSIGSYKQPVEHPLLTSMRQVQNTLRSYLVSMKLPDPTADDPAVTLTVSRRR